MFSQFFYKFTLIIALYFCNIDIEYRNLYKFYYTACLVDVVILCKISKVFGVAKDEKVIIKVGIVQRLPDVPTYTMK